MTADKPEDNTERKRIWASLSVRLGGLLSIALVPLGVIALSQTQRIERELAEQIQLNLQSTTVEVATLLRIKVSTAFGTAQALAAAVPDLLGDELACDELFDTVVETSRGELLFAGYIPNSGVVNCSSREGIYDLSERPTFAGLLASSGPRVDVSAKGLISEQPVIIVTRPVMNEGEEIVGYITLSLPQSGLGATYSDLVRDMPSSVLTFNRTGEILSASVPLDEVQSVLPVKWTPARYLGREAEVFRAIRQDGQQAVFAAVPIVEGTMYALGSWPLDTAVARGPWAFLRSPTMFPIAMWLASLGLVTFAVERQVVRQIRLIALQMRRFARNRTLPDKTTRDELPTELLVIEDEFMGMAEQLLQDEAELVNMLHEKDVLMKEVHHRVKNNLQLISSIVNMQERRAVHPETVRAMENINQRVSSMATVHRTLYEAETLGRARADELLRRVISPLIDLQPARTDRKRISYELVLDPVALYPDQALPITLLTVEALTNALKYTTARGDAPPWLRVTLKSEGGTVTLSIANSIGGEDGGERHEGTKMGSRLIRSFARQLGSTPETEITDTCYILTVRFASMDFDPTADSVAPELSNGEGDGETT